MYGVAIWTLLVPALSTMLGGLLAIRLRLYMDLLIAVGAGLLLGATFLDLLPEALKLGRAAGYTYLGMLGFVLVVFLFFYALDAALSVAEQRWAKERGGQWMRRTGAALYVFHSLRDGMAIGASFAASQAAGYAVTFGIAAHDLGDGMNTVLLTTRGEKPVAGDYGWLVADALAPVAGGLLAYDWLVNSRGSIVMLLLAAGFFLQLAVCSFLPRLQRCARRGLSLAGLAGGALIIWAGNLLSARLH